MLSFPFSEARTIAPIPFVCLACICVDPFYRANAKHYVQRTIRVQSVR